MKKSTNKPIRNRVTLGAKSLTKVWDWCEKNEHEMLSIAYMDACVLLVRFLEKNMDEIKDKVSSSYSDSEKDKHTYRITAPMYHSAMELRDLIGRNILDMLKRESSQKWRNNPKYKLTAEQIYLLGEHSKGTPVMFNGDWVRLRTYIVGSVLGYYLCDYYSYSQRVSGLTAEEMSKQLGLTLLRPKDHKWLLKQGELK
jgi:hypothetical protein